MFDKFNQGRTAILLAILIVIIYFVYQGRNTPSELIYNGKIVEIADHAACRMDCRKVSKEDVRQVLLKGKQNDEKSEPNHPSCPRFVLESKTNNKEALRIVIADCEDKAILITVIDLKNNYKCDCE